MIATVPFVKETFDRFNALCFEGELPDVMIVLTKATTFLGKMEYKSKHGLFGAVLSNYDFRLKISIGFDLAPEELEDVVIHEMIHYYIAFRNLRDTSAHGVTFRRLMEKINREYGRHITIRHRADSGCRLVRTDAGRMPIEHYLCISTFPDGSAGVTVCATTRIAELCRELPGHFRISKMEWYVSRDPYFDRYPRARTPKIYRISEEDLAEHLSGALPLRRV